MLTDRQDFPLLTSIGAVTLRQTFNAVDGGDTPSRLILRAPSGETLLEAIVPAGAAEALRARWRGWLYALVFFALGVTVLLVAAACIFYRNVTKAPATRMAITAVIIGLFVGARILFWWAATPGEWTDDAVGSPVAYASLLLRGIHRSPLDLPGVRPDARRDRRGPRRSRVALAEACAAGAAIPPIVSARASAVSSRR